LLHGGGAFAQSRDGLLEVLQGVEVLINGSEAQVGNYIKVAQRFKDGKANLIGINLSHTGGADHVFDTMGEQSQIIWANRAALAGFTNTRQNFLTAERFSGTGTFDNGQASCLNGGEATLTTRALPPSSRGRAVIGGA
jgi:hypothetical protein